MEHSDKQKMNYLFDQLLDMICTKETYERWYKETSDKVNQLITENKQLEAENEQLVRKISDLKKKVDVDEY